MTISGPPSTLKNLADTTPSFKGFSRVSLPVHGPYHAGHIYNEICITRILQPFHDILESSKPRLPILSSFTGDRISAPTTLDLVKTILEDILQKPLHWNLVTESAVLEAEVLNASECTILPVGPATISKGLTQALNSNKKCVASLDDSLWNIKSPQEDSHPGSGKFSNSKIAIVGMAGRFPNAENHELFWELLEKGTDTHQSIPRNRFDKAHIDPTGRRKNTSHTPYGCFLDQPGLFDPRFFSMSPREATQTDPMHRLAILTAYEALEMSGFVPNRTPSTKLHRIGTFYGQTSDDWREVQEAQDIDTYFIPGGVRAFAPGRINYYFKFTGPSFSVDTACSSSFAALQLAINALQAGDCDTAVTGGMNVLTNPDIFSGLSRGQFLSKTGNCQTFDNDADGYCRGEAVGTVILKRLEDAEADKDNILGVILASATNHSANAVSITHPHAGAQEYLYRQLLGRSDTDANDISYVEMHGTGTQAGDGTEMKSVTNVFASPQKKRLREQPLHLGAVKANIGHGEAASGVSALIKVLLMMEKNAIPPNCGIKGVINQGFPKDLNARNVHIPISVTPWSRIDGQKRRVYISNFSAAGGNTGVIMEDAPLVRSPESQDPRSTQVVAISGKSKSSMRRNVQKLLDYIAENPDVALSSLSYTTTARRSHYNYRVAIADSDLSRIKASLSASLEKDISPISATRPGVAFVFTGQGSHYAGLGKQLFEVSSQFRSDIFQFDQIGRSQGFPSFRPLIDGSAIDCSSLSPTVVQLGMTCVQMALARLWMSWGIAPSVVVGHSLGEYAALNVAGVLSASDTIHLVGGRASRLEIDCTPGTHAMLAVTASVAAVESYFDNDFLEIACINSANETVLGGSMDQIDQVAEKLSEDGIKNTKLQIPFAFHISQVDPILDKYEELANGVTFNRPSIPVISPLLGEVVRDGGFFNPGYVRRHARETVKFVNGIETGTQDGILNENTIWVEIGPHPVCLAMIKKTLGATVSVVPSLRRNEECWKVVSSSLASLHTIGLDINWNEYHRDFNAAQQLLRLPTYGFDFKNYWIDYTGNWCLTKGDIGAISDVPESKPKLSTTSVQKVVEESIEDITATVTVESDISEPTLKAAINGHLVNGSGLCPSVSTVHLHNHELANSSQSLYADMALTVAEYLYQRLKPDSRVPSMNVGKMEVEKPLIVGGNKSQLLRVQGIADMTIRHVKLQYYSVSSDGQKATDHAKCLVEYEDADALLSSWQRAHYLVAPRIEALLKGVNEGTAEKIRRNTAYELFGSFVQYGQSYRGMEEVTLDSDNHEATARLAFQTTNEDGNFVCSPYWIDSIGHLSGFVVNVKEALGSKAQVYVSHGWDSMRFARPLSADRIYRSYVRMQAAGDKIMAGDVYLFEDDVIIGVVGGLKFQCIPRSLLNTFLLPATGLKREPAPAAMNTHSKPSSEKAKPKTQPSAPRPTQMNRLDAASVALKIVADEIGVPMSELADNVVFADMGVDSLMSLTISGRLREELDMEISSQLFSEYPSVKVFRGFFSGHESESKLMGSLARSTSSSTLESQGSCSTQDGDAPSTPATKADDEDLVNIIRDTIASEMDVPAEEIVGTTDLTTLGMDSLMSLTILAKLRERTGQDLSPGFFLENPTSDAIEIAINPKSKPTLMPTIEKSDQEKPAPQNITTSPQATSFLLQGNPKTATKTLFLFPDGSGSATSYALVPKISPNIAVYGLNCPFMKSPEDFLCGIDGVSAIYKAEVRCRQPKGPYHLGGWSAGGVVAFEVALQLMRESETVERLILLDSPCPIGLEPLPSRLHHFFDEIGLLGTGTGEVPGWLLPHFERSIHALDVYKPTPMDPKKAPKTFAIWAKEGVCGKPGDPRPEVRDDDPKSMKWLLENRTDFGTNGWDKLLGKGKMRFATVGCNHFTMMREPVVSLPSPNFRGRVIADTDAFLGS